MTKLLKQVCTQSLSTMKAGVTLVVIMAKSKFGERNVKLFAVLKLTQLLSLVSLPAVTNLLVVVKTEKFLLSKSLKMLLSNLRHSLM